MKEKNENHTIGKNIRLRSDCFLIVHGRKRRRFYYRQLDSGVDMWTGTGSGNFSFSSSGGNPGGFIRFDDSSGTSAEGWIYAPAKFLGNWSDWENQASISWDSLIIQKGGAGELLEAARLFQGREVRQHLLRLST